MKFKKVCAALMSCLIMGGCVVYLPQNYRITDTKVVTSIAQSAVAYQQSASPWGSHVWTSVGDKNQTLASSACGLFSFINAVNYKTGNFIEPTSLADWSKSNGYRTRNNGVDTRFFKAYCETFGSEKGVSYAGKKESVSSALEHVRNGGAICGCVPGHWIAIVDYDNSTGKYLLLDSAYSERAGSNSYKRTQYIKKRDGWTSKGVAWVDGSIFTSGGGEGTYSLSGRWMAALSFSSSNGGSAIIEGFQNAMNIVSNSLPWNYPYPNRTLKVKSPIMSGDDVKWLQSTLSYCGYSCNVDGLLGQATASQIKKYQSDNNLKVDGIAGTATLSSLKAKAEGGKSQTSDGKTSNTQNYSIPSRTIKYVKGNMMRGNDVKWIQAALNKWGENIVVDGIYGKDTKSAVVRFQILHLLVPDGIVGGKTLEKMKKYIGDPDYTPIQTSAETILRYGYPKPSRNLKSGSKGDDVRWLQVALNNTISAGLDIDGHFGAKTLAAVKQFQSSNGLTSDGIFGSASRSKMEVELSARNITICGGSTIPEIATIDLLNKKTFYAEEESVSFVFDSDCGEEFTLTIVDEYGDVVYDFVTDEYDASVVLQAGNYIAYISAKNDKGSVKSNSVHFTVFKQSNKEYDISQLRSSVYGLSISYNKENHSLYTSNTATYESMWQFIPYEDWTFDIYNVYHGGKLVVNDGGLAVTEESEDDVTSGNWYLYECDGMSFIKNVNSNLTITISSDGEIFMDNIDLASNAQSIDFAKDSRTTVVPRFNKIDDTHAELSWNAVSGAESYTVLVYEFDGITEDGIYSSIDTSETSCIIEIPENVDYDVYMEAYVAGDVIIGMGMDDNDVSPETPDVPTEENIIKEEYENMLIQLKKYLLSEKGYSPTLVNELDMNYDGRLDVFDMIILRQLYEES